MPTNLLSCPHGCGVRHENGVPTRTNCARYRGDVPRQSSVASMSVISRSVGRSAVQDFTAGETEAGRKAAHLLAGRIPDDFDLSTKEREELVDALRWGDDEFDEDEAAEMDHDELVESALAICHESPTQTVDGADIDYIDNGRQTVKDISLMVSECAVAELANEVLADESGLFSNRDETEKYIVSELKTWHRFQQGDIPKSEQCFANSLRAYDPLNDRFDYAGPEPHFDGQKKRRERDEALVRAQYRLTQQELADLGISEVSVYRGMGWTADSPDWPENERDSHQVTPSNLKPMFEAMSEYNEDFGDEDYTSHRRTGEENLFSASSVASFSTSPDRALQFALSHGEFSGPLQDNAVVVHTTVPADMVLALPTTGCAYYAEDEVLIYGGASKRHPVEMELLRRNRSQAGW